MTSDFDYKKYSLEKLQEWVHDALSSGEASSHEIYSAIREAVQEDYQYYKDHSNRALGLLELMSGHRPVKDESVDDGMRPWGHSDLEYLIANKDKPLSCDKDDKSPECQNAWNDFWEETYYPEEYYKNVQPSATQRDIDKEIEAIRESGGYEWTPDPEVSRNDSTRLKVESGWVYESPDGGKTVTKRKVGSDEKIVVKQDKVKKWVLPVEEVRDEDTDEDIYCVTFPDDLLEAANLKEGDEIEWVDLGDGSYRLEKVPKAIRMDEC
jgi:hypothetical protein